MALLRGTNTLTVANIGDRLTDPPVAPLIFKFKIVISFKIIAKFDRLLAAKSAASIEPEKVNS